MPASSKLYWTDFGESLISRANMHDGSDVEHLITTNLKYPNGLAVDSESMCFLCTYYTYVT